MLLCVEQNVQLGFKSLLEAGGATVIHVEFATCTYSLYWIIHNCLRPPFTKLGDATHAFIDAKPPRLGLVNVKDLVAHQIPCLKPEYIAEYLARDPLPKPSDYTVSLQ